MKKFTFIFPVFLAVIVLLMASCGSSRSFSFRKYTAGNYVSHKHKPGKVSVLEIPEQEPVLAAKDEVLSETPAATKPELPNDQPVATDKTALGMASAEAKPSSSTQSAEQQKALAGTAVKPKTHDGKARAFHAESLKHYISDRVARKAVAADEGESALDPVALVSFILGILGLALNILAISVIVATAEYIFTLLFIAGLVMGIIAVVFGSQGIRRHNKNNTGTLNLVFSIIGTALGAGAIITAFIFAFYTLILAATGF